RLGAGEYIVSVGLFKEMNMLSSMENQSYCVLDRAVCFKVTQGDEIYKNLGNFAHPVMWSQKETNWHYDPLDIETNIQFSKEKIC
ncbi:MAG: hypothetical protein ACK4PR_09215, partial [Gammaproteobacteria bacterium]